MLQRYLLAFSLLFILGSAHAQAQTAPSPATFTRADTARAVHALFRSRRGGGIGWLALGTASILASTLPAQQTTSAGVWTPGVIAGSAFLLIGLNKSIQFWPGRERRVLRELAANGHLPVSVMRRLRGKFAPMMGSEYDYNPLMAKGIYPTNPALAPTPEQLLANAHNDTLRAIGNLFERRRLAGKRWTYVAVTGLIAVVRAVISVQSNGNNATPGDAVLLAVPIVGIPAAASISNFVAYSEKREEQVDRDFRSGKPLPRKICHRLKKKDFE